MGYGLDIVTGPAAEPITLAQAQAQTGIDLSEFNTRLSVAIANARQYCEARTGRAIITQTWKLTLDQWPCRPNESTVNRSAILLPRPPVQSVTSVKYIDPDGDQQTLVSGTDYIVHLSDPVSRICPYPGTAWPAIQTGYPGAIEVIFVCGYGSVVDDAPPSNIPGNLIRGMLMALTHFIDNPSDEITGTIVSKHSLASDVLFDAYTVAAFGYEGN